METKLYNQKGEAVGSYEAPAEVFNLPWNADLVHQVVTSMLSTRRSGTAHTKDRGDVSGGGKKPWQQKGTGRARHGSIRSPLWRGGGTTFGPRTEKNYGRKINRSMKRKALLTVLSKKFKDGEVIFLNELVVDSSKTKDAKRVFDSLAGIEGMGTLAGKSSNALVLALPGKNSSVEKSFRNFGNITVTESRSLNPVDLLAYRFVAIVNPDESLKTLIKA